MRREGAEAALFKGLYQGIYLQAIVLTTEVETLLSSKGWLQEMRVELMRGKQCHLSCIGCSEAASLQ